MSLWSEQIDEMFAQRSGSNPVCESAPVFFLNQDFFNTLTLGAIVSRSLHLPRGTKPSQSKVFLTKERDDIERRTSKHWGSSCLQCIRIAPPIKI